MRILGSGAKRAVDAAPRAEDQNVGYRSKRVPRVLSMKVPSFDRRSPHRADPLAFPPFVELPADRGYRLIREL